MADKKVSLKKVYGKPLSKGQSLPLTTQQMRKAGKIILDSVKKEIRRDMAMSVGVRGKGEPVSLPNTSKFVDSFSVNVVGNQISINSTWPTARAHASDPDRPDSLVTGVAGSTGPIVMSWLTRPEVPFAQIVLSNGETIIRTTPDPSKGDKPWIHPGFRRYTFLERGIRKGRKLALESLVKEALESALKKRDLF